MTKKCPNCGKQIAEKRGDAKFCSRSCQNQYNYKLKTGQLKGLGNLTDLKMSEREEPEETTPSLEETIQGIIQPETNLIDEQNDQPKTTYKTPSVDAEFFTELMGDTDFKQNIDQNQELENVVSGDERNEDFEEDHDNVENTEETENPSLDEPLPEQYITKEIKTDNPLYLQNEKSLKDNRQLKQKLELEYAKLEAELKRQQGRNGNSIIALGAIGGSLYGYVDTPIKAEKKEPEKKNEMVLIGKDGKPLLRSIKNKWQKIKVTDLENKEPSFLERLGNLLLFGSIGTAAGLITKAATEDWREKDKKEKITAINRRMEEIRKDYAILNRVIADNQKRLVGIPKHLLSTTELINPEYEQALNGINQKKEENMKKNNGKNNGKKPKRFKSKKVIPATELGRVKFSVFDFKGLWREFFGLPSINFHILIHGNSGEGKSTFCLWFAKYLAENHGEVLYVSGEEGISKTFHDKLMKCAANVDRMNVIDVSSGDEFMKEIEPNEAHFIFLDSLHDMDIEAEKLKEIFARYPNTAFICIDQNNKKGDLLGANEKKHIVDVVVNVKNYEAETTKNRFKAKNISFKTKDFPGSEKRDPKKGKGSNDNDGYDLGSDRKGIV